MRIDERTDKTSASQYEVPEIPIRTDSADGTSLHAFLTSLSALVARHIKETHPDAETYPDMMIGNYGNSYRCDAFTIHCYDWNEELCDDDEDNQDTIGLNDDCYLDVKTGAAVSWYKHAQRGVCVNEAMSEAIHERRLHELLERAYDAMFTSDLDAD